MGAWMDYFSAADDAVAAGQLDVGEVPGAVCGNGIDPAVMMGTLEALLTGRTYDDVRADPRQCALVAQEEDCAVVVTTLTDGVRDALAGASLSDLRVAAAAWGRTEEFNGEFDGDEDAGELAELVEAFADLSREARSAGHHLYCRISM
ncbi:hypothetical protein [Streptomyces sp. VRA16 Mangrove soil]|uniref:hypothetical protein n=1 Tax=Streptomyces sp. VRA16 Mangrove soil TaxID=2817434 RepID=UPI001A9FC079|nr:hypothetical protein [Streptomyces sp. VRA16 Mangrove soil]MBO1331325.1 hypothetical protein [Streptomyces sp. VRA16 Mangrove soil]